MALPHVSDAVQEANSFTLAVCCSCGGKCLSVEYTDKVGEVAKSHGLKLHIDGARIFNASVVSSVGSIHRHV